MQYHQDVALQSVGKVPLGGESKPIGDTSPLSIIRRIRECVEHETRSIKSASNFDAKESNARKSRLLYELGRAIRASGAGPFGPEHQEDFLALKTALAENETVLRAHVAAVSEVAGILQQAIEREEADGTYSSGGYRPQPSI